MSVFILQDKNDSKRYYFYCPGCECHHFINTKWGIDLEKNTLTPSVLVKSVSPPSTWDTDKRGDYIFDQEGSDGRKRARGAKDTVCHTFVRDGKIQYLNDCTHDLKGQTVSMIELEE